MYVLPMSIAKCLIYVINSMQVFDREGYDKPTIISQTFILYICKDAKLQLKMKVIIQQFFIT